MTEYEMIKNLLMAVEQLKEVQENLANGQQFLGKRIALLEQRVSELEKKSSPHKLRSLDPEEGGI